MLRIARRAERCRLQPLALKTAKSDGDTLAQMPLGVSRIPHMPKSPQIDPVRDSTEGADLAG